MPISYGCKRKISNGKMTNKIILLVIFNVLLSANSQEVKMEKRDFHGYLPPEENRPDHQIFPYPQNYPYKEEYAECVKNPMLPLLGKGLNLLLLKLGVVGIIKAIMAFIFMGFLVKLPLLLLKVAFLKSFFLPLFFAPFLMHVFTNQMHQSTESTSENKPGESASEMPGMLGMNEMSSEMGRQLSDNLTSVAWQSMKMFVESDQCIERISCMIGASSKDSSMGNIFNRVLKYLHYSSPLTLQKRMTSIREAFSKGSRSSTCLPQDYECQSPELLLQYGIKKIKIL